MYSFKLFTRHLSKAACPAVIYSVQQHDRECDIAFNSYSTVQKS